MNDRTLDILRALAKRQADAADKNSDQSSTVDSAYEINEETNQKVEPTSVEANMTIFHNTATDPVSSSEMPENLDLYSNSKNIEEYEINEFDEKTEGCTSRPAPPAEDADGMPTYEINELPDPPAWAVGFAQLDPELPPADVPLKRWRQLITDCGRLSVDGVFAKAAQLSWTEIDIFGCDREKPFARIDLMGLVWFIDGGRVLGMSRSAAVISTASGAQQTYRRRDAGTGQLRQIPVWKLFGQGGL